MKSEHRAQSVIAAFQCLTVLSGTVAVAMMLKAVGYPDARDSWPGLVVFIRDWGLVLLTVPSVWVLVTVYFERMGHGDRQRRWVVVSGLLVLLALFFFYLVACARLFISPISHSV